MTMATCCEAGSKNIRWEHTDTIESDFGWMIYDWYSGIEVKYCPWCGQKPGSDPLPATLEEALTCLLNSHVRLTICFDVDGVCADHALCLPYADRKPYPWVSSLMKELKRAGHTLVFQTARYMQKYDGDQNKARQSGEFELKFWLRCNDIPYDEVYLGKCSADIYVDDKGCRVESDKGETDWCGSFMKIVKATQERKQKQYA